MGTTLLLCWPFLAQAADETPEFRSAGLESTVSATGNAASQVIHLDLDKFVNHFDFWNRYIVSRDTLNRFPLHCAYSITLNAVGAAHIWLSNHPETKYVSVSGDLTETVASFPETHEIFRLILTTNADKQIDWGGQVADSIPKFVTYLKLSPWLSAALDAENARAESKAVAPMSVDDFILDGTKLMGKVISVAGYTVCTGPMCMLFRDPADFTKSIYFNQDILARDDRSGLMACNLLTRCEVVLTGVVKDAPLEDIDANRVQWINPTAPPSSGQTRSIADEAGSVDHPISVKDFILDERDLITKTVTLSGDASCDANSCYLSESNVSEQDIITFDASAFSREERKRLLDCFSPLGSDCAVFLTGIAAGNKSVRATMIRWR